jgi:uncharacterized protein YfeS
MHDRDVIAPVFVLLKIDGACERKIAQIALEALARRLDPDIAAKLGWKPIDQRSSAALKVETDLRKCLGL